MRGILRPLITGGTPAIDRNSGNTLIGDTSASSSQERVCLTQKLWVAYVAALGVANEHSEVVADNDDMFSVFKMFCKRCPPLEPCKGKKNMDFLMTWSSYFFLRWKI
ncbi:hypothetical protein P3S67_003874 [Capsicum chacoense]